MTSFKKKHQHNSKAKCRVQFLFVNSNILKCKKKVEGAKFDTPNTHINDRSLSWLGTDTSIKSGGVKIVLWTQTSSPSERYWVLKDNR